MIKKKKKTQSSIFSQKIAGVPNHGAVPNSDNKNCF